MNREKEIIKTSIFGIIGNVFLVIFKAFVGFISNSIAIINDAINNLSDAMSSTVTIIGTKLANKRPNKKHPYGYGRLEYLTSTIIGVIVFGAGGVAIYESVLGIIEYFKEGKTATYSVASLIIIGVAIVVKLVLSIYFRKQGKKLESTSLLASGTDAFFDALLTASTLIGAIISKITGIYIEGYLGILLGLFILKAGVEIIRSTISLIIGVRFSEEFNHQIKKEILEVVGVLGVYDLIINSYGSNRYIASVHVEVKNDMKAVDIQRLEREIASKMYLNHNIIMTVGIYAQNEETPFSKEMLKKIRGLLSIEKHVLQLHGFYIDEINKFVNFDLVISFDEPDPSSVSERVKEELLKDYPEYKFIITLDSDYA